MLNVGLNQVCAVYNVPYRGVQYPGTARDTMLAAMREAQALAAREGVTLTDADISAWMKMTDALNPDGMPSMRQGYAGPASHRGRAVRRRHAPPWGEAQRSYPRERYALPPHCRA